MNETTAKILEAMPGTRRDIAERTSLAYMTIRRHLAVMKVGRDYHVSGWSSGHPGKPVPTFSAGPGTSVPLPPRSTFAERVAASRARARGDA